MRKLVNKLGNETKLLNGILIKSLLLTVIMADSKQFISQINSVTYTRVFVMLYN